MGRGLRARVDQWATRKWLYGDIQLHRKNLIERLELDHNLYLGFLRMANYVFIFVLLIFSLQTSHPAPTRMCVLPSMATALKTPDRWIEASADR